jgi:autotransporter-associated beta strand protein
MSMQNGTFNLTGNAATASTDEAVGTLSLDSGANFITLTQATSTNISTRFTAGTLSRTNNAVAFIRGSGAIGQSGFGTSTTTQLRITNSPTADVIGGGGSFNSGTATNISIFPYLVADSSATGAVSGLVGYDPTNDSIRILKSGEYSSIASGTSTSNVKNSTTSQAVAVAAGTYNSMVLNQAASPGGTVTDTLGGTVVLNSGVLLFTAAGTLRDTIVTGGQLQFAAADLAGVSRKEGNIINGNGKDVRLDTAITGSGGMTFSTFNSGANVSSVTLNNTSNSWTGTTTLNGLIKLGQAGVVPDASSVYVGKGGTLDMASFSEAIDGLTGVGNVDTTTSSATPTLTLGSNGGNGTFGGVIQNSGASSSLAVVKTGAGTQAFTNANTYSGGTNITGGTLLANNATNSTGAGSVIVQSTGTLGGTGKVNGSVTVQNNGNLLAGDGTATMLTLGSDLTMASGSTLKLALGAAGAHSTLARAGGTWSFDGNQNVFLVELTTLTGTETYDNVVTGLAADPGSLANWHITNSDVSGTFTYDGSGGVDLALSPVPEPGSLAAFGGIALALLRRRVRRNRNS